MSGRPLLLPGACRAGGALRWVALLALVLLVAACTRGEAGGPLPPPTPTVEVDIVDDDVVAEGPVPAGRVVFRIENDGEEPHQLSLLLVAEDTPPIEEQLQDPPEQSPTLVARVPLLRPGETSVFAVGLAAGQRYALVDLSQPPEGEPPAERGVAAEFHTEDTDDAE